MTHEQIIRAWKDEDYRLNMNGEELSALPAHPAGLVELSDQSLLGVAGLEEEAWTKKLCEATVNLSINVISALVSWLTSAICVEEAP